MAINPQYRQGASTCSNERIESWAGPVERAMGAP
jgi:hypothetical protein